MGSLRGFGVKNLRSLTDTGLVPLKPLTLLVGRNSSGKSTFLRSFPLLRQSVENKRRSPIRWHQKGFVDFGSIQDATNENNMESGVTFSFRVNLSERHEAERLCELSMTVVSGERDEYVRAYDVNIDGHKAQIELGPDHRATVFKVNGRDVLRGHEAGLHSACLIGGLVEGAPVKSTVYESFQDREEFFPVTGMRELLSNGDFLDREVDKAIQSVFLIDGKMMQERTWRVWHPAMGTTEEILASIRDKGGVLRDASADAVEELVACVVAERMTDVLAIIDWRVSEFMAGVAYLAPQRAMGERIYRLGADVPVDSIDPRGENLADFLAALDPGAMESLAEYTCTYLGFEPAIRVNGKVAELLIRDAPSGQFRSITDVGFGFAEVLPLCVTLWLNMNLYWETKNPATTMLALEQPELHLHPAHQARLASLMAGSLKQSRAEGFDVPLMIETHSEALINGLGMLVRKKQLDPDDVQIVLFEQDKTTRQTSLRFAGYRESGALHDWPFGFLAPTAERLDDIPRGDAKG